MIKSFFFDDTEIRSKDRPKPRKKKTVGCESCDLQYACDSPKMEPAGLGKKKIVIMGDHPTLGDDEALKFVAFVTDDGFQYLACVERVEK